MKTERLNIKKFAPQDWQALKAIVNDFTRSEYAIYDMPFPTEDKEIKALANVYSQAELFYAVWLGDVMIGYVCFHELGGSYDIGYVFRSDYHGKGYAYEACTYLMAHLAKTRNVKEFTAGTALKNTPSCKMLGKLGFALVGTEMLAFRKDENGNDIAFEGGNFKKEV
ncbi:MAG: GNAT family N-acetyltransferase [Clostridia bacterium]|nr:GNAT family N-acetyltransferase [Clostridia bacterium]